MTNARDGERNGERKLWKSNSRFYRVCLTIICGGLRTLLSIFFLLIYLFLKIAVIIFLLMY